MPVSESPVILLNRSIELSKRSTVNKLYGVAQKILLSPAATSMALLYGKYSFHAPTGDEGFCDNPFRLTKENMKRIRNLTLKNIKTNGRLLNDVITKFNRYSAIFTF